MKMNKILINSEDIIDWCMYCKEVVKISDGFVHTKDKNTYHLDCYHLIHDIDEEIEE